MLDLIKQFISQKLTQGEKIHAVREFLQLFILSIVYDKGYFKNLVFTGGTA